MFNSSLSGKYMLSLNLNLKKHLMSLAGNLMFLFLIGMMNLIDSCSGILIHQSCCMLMMIPVHFLIVHMLFDQCLNLIVHMLSDQFLNLIVRMMSDQFLIVRRLMCNLMNHLVMNCMMNSHLFLYYQLFHQ